MAHGVRYCTDEASRVISTLTRDTVLGLECLAIWKNADGYLAAFGGQPPEAGSNRGRSSETHPRQGSREVRLPLPLAVCHSDSVTVQGLMPGTTSPRMPGHEVIGVVRRSDPTCLAGTWACGSVGSVVRAGTAPDAAAVNRNAYTKAAKSVVAQ